MTRERKPSDPVIIARRIVRLFEELPEAEQNYTVQKLLAIRTAAHEKAEA